MARVWNGAAANSDLMLLLAELIRPHRIAQQRCRRTQFTTRSDGQSNQSDERRMTPGSPTSLSYRARNFFVFDTVFSTLKVQFGRRCGFASVGPQMPKHVNIRDNYSNAVNELPW